MLFIHDLFLREKNSAKRQKMYRKKIMSKNEIEYVEVRMKQNKTYQNKVKKSLGDIKSFNKEKEKERNSLISDSVMKIKSFSPQLWRILCR